MTTQTPPVLEDQYELGTIDVPITHLHADPNNPRNEAGDVTGLAGSISKHGQLQELVVRPFPGRFGHYIIEAGERRWTAARLGTTQTHLRCRVRIPSEAEQADQREQLKRTLITGAVENHWRSDLNGIERAQLYRRLMVECGMTQEEVGKELGIKGPTVSYYLTLLDLSKGLQTQIIKGTLTVSEGVGLVRTARRRASAKRGKRSERRVIEARAWTPPLFTAQHPLAKYARGLCRGLDHDVRRHMHDSGACEHCWDTTIRADQDKITRVTVAQEQSSVPEGAVKTPFAIGNGVPVP